MQLCRQEQAVLDLGHQGLLAVKVWLHDQTWHCNNL